jgi:hypothetical protein
MRARRDPNARLRILGARARRARRDRPRRQPFRVRRRSVTARTRTRGSARSIPTSCSNNATASDDARTFRRSRWSTTRAKRGHPKTFGADDRGARAILARDADTGDDRCGDRRRRGGLVAVQPRALAPAAPVPTVPSA